MFHVAVRARLAGLAAACLVFLAGGPCLAAAEDPPGDLIGVTTADAVLLAFQNDIYHTPLVNPPFTLGTSVSVIRTTRTFLAIRTYFDPKDPSKAGQTGGWIMPLAELRHLTRAQILDEWALPVYADHTRNNEITLVLVPAGTTLWSGIAGPITNSVDGTGDWGQGGGTQYYVGWGAAGIQAYQLALTDYAVTGPMGDGPLLSYGPRLSGDAGAVGRYLDGLDAAAYSDLDGVLTSLDVINLVNPVNAGPLQQAVNQLSPERYGAAATVQADQRALFMDALDRGPHAGIDAPDGPRGLWAWVGGAWGGQDAAGQHTGFGADSWAGVVGGDVQASSRLRLGAAAGYVDSRIDWRDAGASRGRLSSAMVGARVDYDGGGLFVAGRIAAGYVWLRADRRIAIPDTGLLPRGFSTAIDRTARGDTNGQSFDVRLDAGPSFDLGAAQVRPFAGLEYGLFHWNRFTEQGAGAADLVVADHSDQALNARVGAAAKVSLAMVGGLAWDLDGRLTWSARLAGSANTVTAGLAGEPGDFTVTTAGPPRWTLQPALGVTGRFAGGALRLGYEGAFGTRDRVNAATASLSVRF